MQSSEERERMRQQVLEALIRQQQEKENYLEEQRPYLQLPVPELAPPPLDMVQEEPAPEERRVIIIDL